ncbi:MAG: AraC family transcriptional regulator [Gammaproteobacteria bacterium]|nr:AraC family transcriptional regulator [Gammaproteobacteria bacterium]
MDMLVELLQGTRLSGGIFLDVEFTAPWCVSAKVEPEDCSPHAPVPRHIIAYHYVTEGQALVGVEGLPAMAVRAGDIIVLPRNDFHTVASETGLVPIRADPLIQPGPEGGLDRIVHGGGGAPTRLLCGWLGCDDPHNPVLGLLPTLMKLEVADAASAGWIESSLRFAGEALAGGRLDSPAILGRLAESLFMEAVRRYATGTTPKRAAPGQPPHDPVVLRALVLLHRRLEHPWTTGDLASLVGLSRSALHERFTRVTGEAPMAYLARQRLEHAAQRLRGSGEPIARIALECGYGSEAAFSRAFKRTFGAPPARWRREPP